MTRYALDPAMPVLSRPDGVVQVGWDPRRAVLVRPPSGLTTAALGDLLRVLQAGATLAEVQALADGVDEPRDRRFGCGAGRLGGGEPRLRRRVPAPARHRSGSTAGGRCRICWPSALRCSGARIKHSSLSHAAVTADTTDLVVLSDSLVADPRMLRELHAARIPHLPVRVRDGAGLVGPLVLPGVTSCLRCADLHRSDRDAAWPAVAAQLRDTVGSADRATVLATAALALNQVDRVIAAVREGVGRRSRAPATVDARHHARVRRQHRLDGGPPVVAAPWMLVRLLKTAVARVAGSSEP